MTDSVGANGFTVALATVRVRVRGEVIRTCGPTPMVAGDLWEVATFDGGAEALSPGCGVVTRGFFEGISGCHPQVGF